MYHQHRNASHEHTVIILWGLSWAENLFAPFKTGRPGAIRLMDIIKVIGSNQIALHLQLCQPWPQKQCPTSAFLNI